MTNQTTITEWDLHWLRQARLISTRSKDPSTQTGAVIANGKNFISQGYNGFPRLMEDRHEWLNDRPEKYRRVIHCEMNAAMLAPSLDKLAGATLYTFPFLSCDRCFVHMVQYGLTRFLAPAMTEDQAKRWGDAIDWVKTEAARMNLVMIEVPLEQIG